jgi:hypothetical protein
MAKVVIEFDTNEKSLAVTIDGQAVDNVVCVDVCRRGYYGYGPADGDGDEPEFQFAVTQSEKDKANDTTKMTRIVAAASAEGRAAGALRVEGIDDIRVVPAKAGGRADSGRAGDKVVAEIVDYFSDEG